MYLECINYEQLKLKVESESLLFISLFELSNIICLS